MRNRAQLPGAGSIHFKHRHLSELTSLLDNVLSEEHNWSYTSVLEGFFLMSIFFFFQRDIEINSVLYLCSTGVVENNNVGVGFASVQYCRPAWKIQWESSSMLHSPEPPSPAAGQNSLDTISADCLIYKEKGKGETKKSDDSWLHIFWANAEWRTKITDKRSKDEA